MVGLSPMGIKMTFIGGLIGEKVSPNGDFTLKGNGIGGTPPIEPVERGSNGVRRCPKDQAPNAHNPCRVD